jgi:hypothetical protein
MWQRDLLASCGGGGMISLPLCVVSDQHSTERESGSILGLNEGIDLFGGPFRGTG